MLLKYIYALHVHTLAGLHIDEIDVGETLGIGITALLSDV